ncbi:Eukaryotic translation initiation factor 2-alpha kinase 1 [Astathelohania contejeani]|uniref:non-specific serine/threonine protein kinase n=1 Tax=Astathelohania contejeani TaxID=164912 RepID=A0ABQ7I166_9MICR|nr:Eukaryotic translation initiation factor 2-alpha kinase 1 [Thelohania contejeani]
MNMITLKNHVKSFNNVIRVGRGAFGTVYKIINTNQRIVYALKETKIENIGATYNKDVLNIGRHVNLLEYFGLFISKRLPKLDHLYKKKQFARSNSFYQYVLTKYCKITLRNFLEDRNQIFNENEKLIEKFDICNCGVIRLKSTKFINKKLVNFIFKSIVRGVLFLHQHNIIHRDLKPENIFFEDEFSLIPKIGDFGCCKNNSFANPDKKDEFLKSIEVGSFNYTAPEVITGIYDNKIDVYSLGLIYLEMLYPMITNMERIYIFDEIKHKGRIPGNIEMGEKIEYDIINLCIKESPQSRISVRKLFALLVNL